MHACAVGVTPDSVESTAAADPTPVKEPQPEPDKPREVEPQPDKPQQQQQEPDKPPVKPVDKPVGGDKAAAGDHALTK